MTTRFQLLIENSVGTLLLEPITSTRPPTFDRATLDAFDAVLAETESAIERGELRLLFIQSASARFFCTGANIAALETLNENSIAAWVTHGHHVFNRLARLPVPTVARVEGYALGGGLELALACDMIFASDTAQFGQTEAALGFVAGWGGSFRLPQRVGVARASELFFSARAVGAEEALGIGLVEFCGSPDRLATHCAEFSRAVLAGSLQSHRQHKRLLHPPPGFQLDDFARAEAESSAQCLRSHDTLDRVKKFLQRRK